MNRRAKLISELAPYALSAVLVLIFYAPRLLPGACFILGDYKGQFVPNRVYAWRSLQQGRLPQWTENLFGGYPFLSDPQSAVFYPPHLALSFAPFDIGTSAVMDAVVLSAVMILAWGAVFLARGLGLGVAAALAVSILVAFNGYQIQHLGHVNIIQTFGTGLWAAGCLVRAGMRTDYRWAAAAGLLLACAVFCGHPQTLLHLLYAITAGMLTLGLQRAWRERCRQPLRTWPAMLLLAVAIGGLGALIQILPTRELLSHSERARISLVEALYTSSPPDQFPGLWFPGLYQPLPWRVPKESRFLTTLFSWSADGAWENRLHLGLAGFMLGLLGWLCRRRSPAAQVLFFGSIFLWLASLGLAGGVYPLLHHYLPGFRQTRLPPRLMEIAFTAWALLAGLAVQSLVERRAELRRGALSTALILLLLLTAGGAAIYGVRLQSADWTAAFARLFIRDPTFVLDHTRSATDFTRDIAQQLLIAVVSGALCLAGLVAAARTRRVKLLAAGILAALFLELALYGMFKNIGFMPDYKLSENVALKPLTQRPAGRILDLGARAWDINTVLAHDLNYARGYNPLLPRWIDKFLPATDALQGDQAHEDRLDRWNVSTLLAQQTLLAGTLNGEPVDLPWLGYTSLGRHAAQAAATAAEQDGAARHWKLATQYAARRVQLLSAGERVNDLPDGFVLGELRLTDGQRRTTLTFPVRLGIETADWMDDPGIASDPADDSTPPRHSRPPAAVHAPPGPNREPGPRFYCAAFELPDAFTLTEVEIEIFAPWPQKLHLGTLIVEAPDGGRHYFIQERELHPTRNVRWEVFERPGAPGYAWMAPASELEPYRGAYFNVWAHYQRPTFDARRTVLLNEKQIDFQNAAALDAPDPPTFRGRVEIERRSPECYTLRTRANQRGWLVLAQSWYPGWRAELDGRPADLIRANGAHCALAVPAGEHSVTLRFRTPGLLLGAGVSALTWCATLLYLVRTVRPARPRANQILRSAG